MLIFFLFLHKNICCGYSLEVPRQGTSKEYLQHMFLWRNKKNISLIPTLIYTYEAGKEGPDQRKCGLTWVCVTHTWQNVSCVMHHMKYLFCQSLCGLDTLTSFSIIFYKGDNFCDFLFPFLYFKPLLKRGLL